MHRLPCCINQTQVFQVEHASLLAHTAQGALHELQFSKHHWLSCGNPSCRHSASNACTQCIHHTTAPNIFNLGTVQVTLVSRANITTHQMPPHAHHSKDSLSSEPVTCQCLQDMPWSFPASRCSRCSVQVNPANAETRGMAAVGKASDTRITTHLPLVPTAVAVHGATCLCYSSGLDKVWQRSGHSVAGPGLQPR